MGRYRVGCTGWGYDDWRGGFYPPGTPAGEYLSRYARVFSVTEVDSTYYRAPSRSDVARWDAATPADFRFSLKMPGDLTHGARLRGVDDQLGDFLSALEPLRASGKLGPLLLQLPATFTRDKDEPALLAFLEAVPRDYRLAVELRHRSWWTPETYASLAARGAALVWSVNQYAETPPVVTADFLYARFIGDRAITRFDRIQRDGSTVLRSWRARFEDEGRSASEAYVLLNNHFMGYAPQTAVIMQEILGVPKADLSAAARTGGQSSLMGFG